MGRPRALLVAPEKEILELPFFVMEKLLKGPRLVSVCLFELTHHDWKNAHPNHLNHNCPQKLCIETGREIAIAAR